MGRIFTWMGRKLPMKDIIVLIHPKKNYLKYNPGAGT